MDAADRLRKFKQTFEVMKGKWDNYSSGEELFGLAVTKYPELEDIQEKIANLDKLYSLYVAVIQTIRGYGDVLWVDVVTNIEEMSNAVNAFQGRAKTLPKALRDWPAYKDCRKVIDDFLELLPLVQSLTDPAVNERHWTELQAVTKTEVPYQQARCCVCKELRLPFGTAAAMHPMPFIRMSTAIARLCCKVRTLVVLAQAWPATCLCSTCQQVLCIRWSKLILPIPFKRHVIPSSAGMPAGPPSHDMLAQSRHMLSNHQHYMLRVLPWTPMCIGTCLSPAAMRTPLSG
jgi:Dynein heavy chain, N-terminal region 2